MKKEAAASLRERVVAELAVLGVGAHSRGSGVVICDDQLDKLSTLLDVAAIESLGIDLRAEVQ